MTTTIIKRFTIVMALFVALSTGLPVAAQDISQKQLQHLMKSDTQPILLDVRTVEEFEQGHIPNAINIPHKELEARLAELSGKNDSQIVIYCRSGRRAEVAKQVLVDAGYTQLDHLSGDFNAWTSSELPVATGK